MQSMNNLLKLKVAPILVLAGFLVSPVQASDLDTVGVTLLRAVTTNVNGAGVRVAQVEAGAPTWEINPNAVGQPTNLFTWIAGDSPYLLAPNMASTFPNSLGNESGHANAVGINFFGIPGGVATNVAHVDITK